MTLNDLIIKPKKDRQQHLTLAVPYDSILSTPMKFGEPVVTTTMLVDNFWILLDVAGMPVWGLA